MNVVSVQQQENGYDCGVIATAFVTCLVNYIPTETVEFDVAHLRKHLFKCLKAGKMELFPTMWKLLFNKKTCFVLKFQTNR